MKTLSQDLTILGLVLFSFSCQKASHSGGESSSAATSSLKRNHSAVYMEFSGTTLDSKHPHGPLIKTNAILADIGSENFIGLIIPLKNMLQKVSNQDLFFLPVMKSVDAKIWFDQEMKPIEIKNISLDLSGKLTQGLRVAVVGLTLESTLGTKSSVQKSIQALLPEATLNKAAKELLFPDVIRLDEANLRTAATSYAMALIPLSIDPVLKNLELAPIGNISKNQNGALFISVPTVSNTSSPVFSKQDRPVVDLTQSSLGQKIANDEEASKKLREVSGAGICRDEELGSTLFQQLADGSNHVLGFFSLSTSSDTNFKGPLVCEESRSSEKTVSLIVLPDSLLWKKLLERKG